MHAKKYSILVILFVLLALWGCNKPPTKTAKALNSENQANQPKPDGNVAPTGDNSAAFSNNAAQDVPPSTASPRAANGEADSSSPNQVQLTIPAGTAITIRLQQRLSSASAVPGERFEAVLEEPIVVQDQVLAPVGTLVRGHVVAVVHSGRLHHPGELGLTLDSLLVNQQSVPLATSRVFARGASHKKRNWAWIGGGSGGGALIGALAAGGKGALIGSGVGAAAGTTTALLTGKKEVTLGSERQLRFRLQHEVSLPGTNAG